MSNTCRPFVRRALTRLAAVSLVLCAGAAGAAAAPAGVALAAVGDFTGLPFFNYQYGVAKAGSDSNSWLTTQYNDWKAHYIVDVDSEQAKVVRDDATHNDTVSEGIAYGMLLAVYFNDKPTFDKLYNYAKAHMCENIGTQGYLMHWKVRYDDVDISEFRLPFYSLDKDGKPHHTEPYFYMWDAENNVPEENRLYFTTSPPYPETILQAAQYDRKPGSASDADIDMAAALVLAHYRWGGRTDPGWELYAAEAARTIVEIANRDTIGSAGQPVFLTNGSLWGGQAGWNPSYYGPAWFKLFIKFVTSTKENPTIGPMYTALANKDAAYYVDRFKALIATMDAQMQVIQNSDGGSTILFPDWADTTKGYVQPSLESDRRYYLDTNGDGQLDDQNRNGRIDDGINADGSGNINSGDGYNMLSSNYYYDAVRVPWRIGTDYSWYGTESSKAINQKIGNFFKPIRFYVPPAETPNPRKDLVDGYSLRGGFWSSKNRDGFNPNPGGVNNSVTFVNFSSAASMSLDSTFASKCYKAMKSKGLEPYEAEYHYYGNAARMLSLVYMNGKFTRPNRTVMLKSRSNGNYVSNASDSGQLTADDASGRAAQTWFDLINLGNDRVAVVFMQMTKDSQGPNQPTVTVLATRGTAYLYTSKDPTESKGSYETFRVTRHSGGDISLRCDGNGKYVRVNSKGQLAADQSANTATSTRFYLEYKQEY